MIKVGDWVLTKDCNQYYVGTVCTIGWIQSRNENFYSVRIHNSDRYVYGFERDTEYLGSTKEEAAEKAFIHLL